MKTLVVGYRVKVVDENGLRDLHQQDFFLVGFPAQEEALARAKKHKADMERKWPHDCVSLCKLIEKSVLVEEPMP